MHNLLFASENNLRDDHCATERHFHVKGFAQSLVVETEVRKAWKLERLSMVFTANGKTAKKPAKMKLPSLFSCVCSRVKLFVFVMNSRRRYSMFVCFNYLQIRRKEHKMLSLPFAVCR